MYFNNNADNNCNVNTNTIRFNGNTFGAHNRGRYSGGYSGGQYRPYHRHCGHSGRNTRLPYNQIHNDRQYSQHSSNEAILQKPKCETIILDLSTNCQLSETDLRKHFQQTYGTIKKIWFNATNTKGFISFFNPISVDMCLENGDKQIINGISVDVSPLEVEIPPELLSTTGDQSHRLKNLCKSDNKTLTARFPTKHEINEPKPHFNFNLNPNQMKELVKIERIDKLKLMDNILNVNDMKQQLDIILETLLLKDCDYKKRYEILNILEEVLNINGFKCELHLIGSTATGLAFCDSDVDIYVDHKNQSCAQELNFVIAMQLLETIRSILRRGLKLYIAKPIPSQRCPVIRLQFDNMFKDSVFSTLTSDISLSNGLAKHNSRLIRYYCQLEPRFQHLCLLLRFWAKNNAIIGSTNQMSSYAFTQLIVYFCQTQGLLPSLDLLRQLSPMEPLIIKGWNCSFSDHLSIFKQNLENKDLIPELIQKFFNFYCKFDFTTQLISTKSGSTKHKSLVLCQPINNTNEEMQEIPQNTFKLTSIINIEDPFELTHNLCSNLSIQSFNKFCDYLTHISQNYNNLFNEKTKNFSQLESTDNYWGLSRLCVEWDPTPNGYVFPEHFIGYPNLDLILKQDLNESPFCLLKTMADSLTGLTYEWLTQVYQLDCELLAKWDLISGQLSPFAEFYIKVFNVDYQVMDSNTRLQFRQQISDQSLSQMSLFDREKCVTESILKTYATESSGLIPTECHFAIVMNCRLSFPTIELVFIDMKPDFEFCSNLSKFLRTFIALVSHDSKLLTVAQELK